MMDIAFHPAAVQEAVDGYLYYGAVDEDLARDLEQKIDETLDLIQRHPELSKSTAIKFVVPTSRVSKSATLLICWGKTRL